MTESKAGSILLLISAILYFLGSLLMLILLIIMFISPENISVPGELSPTAGIIILAALFVSFIVFGFLQLWASRMMKDSERTKKGGIIALITGIVGGVNLLAVIGGILALVQSGKQNLPEPTPIQPIQITQNQKQPQQV